MDDLRRLLHEGDPLKREPAMSADAADRMRRVVQTEVRRPRVGVPTFVMAMSGALSLVVAAGVWAVGRAPVAVPSEEPVAAVAPIGPLTLEGRRQVQFATPGGTRVIWQLDTTSH